MSVNYPTGNPLVLETVADEHEPVATAIPERDGEHPTQSPRELDAVPGAASAQPPAAPGSGAAHALIDAVLTNRLESSGIAPVNALRARGARIALGMDDASINDDIDRLRLEAKMAEWPLRVQAARELLGPIVAMTITKSKWKTAYTRISE